LSHTLLNWPKATFSLSRLRPARPGQKMCASASAGKARPALSLILCQPRGHWSSGWTRLLSPRPPARN